MKKLMNLVLASVLGGAIAIGSYVLFFKDQQSPVSLVTVQRDSPQNPKAHTTFVSNSTFSHLKGDFPDFVEAAQKTVKAVVHVKNVEIGHSRRSLAQYFYGGRANPNRKFVRGYGSGVIITPDGYIVTNYHVIKGASELDVTLYNNLTYKAKVVGTAPRQDIALLKIDAKNLNYLPFGDSNDVKVGQWVLAVGNPFNLTSTVTAGIISAKGRDLDAGGSRMESYIQTDAAINPGNSGGALVNIHGDLIGINSAISSRTGSFIGYSFAIPSNNARKIVEDLMQYGNVKEALIGISGRTILPKMAREDDYPVSQGVYVAGVSHGAKLAGLEKGDLVTEINGVRLRKMSDLASFIHSKRPGDVVSVNYYRNGKKNTAKIKLTDFKSYDLLLDQGMIGFELTNATDAYLKNFDASHGVRIVRPLSHYVKIKPSSYVIVAIDGKPVSNIDEIKNIMKTKPANSPTRITFQNTNGEKSTYVSRG